MSFMGKWIGGRSRGATGTVETVPPPIPGSRAALEHGSTRAPREQPPDYRALLQRVEPWIPDRGDTRDEDQELARLRADVRTALHGVNA